MLVRRWAILCLIAGGCALGGCAPKAATFSPHSRARSFDALCTTFSRFYAYGGGPLFWRDVRARYRSKVLAAETPRAYLLAMNEMLAELADPHVYLTNDDTWYSAITGKPATIPSVRHFTIGMHTYVVFDADADFPEQPDPPLGAGFYELVSVDGVAASHIGGSLLFGSPGEERALTLLTEDYRERLVRIRCRQPEGGKKEAASPESGITSGRTDCDGFSIGWITIEDFGNHKQVVQFDKALDALMDTDAICLHLVDNPGGFADVKEEILGRFIASRRPYGRESVPSFVAYRGPFHSQAYRVFEMRPIFVTPRGATYRKPVVVTIGPGTGSAAESLAAALRTSCSASIVGYPSVGASAAVFEKRLPDGLTVCYSGLPQHHIDGRDYQYVGLEPDVLVPFDRAALYRDGVDAVRAWWIRSSSLAVERAAELASRDRVRPAMPAAP